MNLVSRFYRHWRAGTLGDRISARLGKMPASERVRWYGAQTHQEATSALLRWAVSRQSEFGGSLLVIGDTGAVTKDVCAGLKATGLTFSLVEPPSVQSLDQAQCANMAAVLCTQIETLEQTRTAAVVAEHPHLADKPFEYVYGLDPAMTVFRERDEYADADFVAPSLLDSPTPHALYEESLKHFEQKCGLRDYLDLYQVIQHIVANQIPGDIAEFGSYKGHSGWLIARSLEALGDTERRVFLFDTFAGFPEEKGLDHFWAHTHKVDFDSIRAKFADRANVELVRGDFTETLAASKAGPFALAYVDCDSYRATKWLIKTLWPDQIAPRGAMVFEDYGHPALLGNRVAIHEGLPPEAGGIRYYSQFSGLYFAYRA